jgi:hypothetical protein
MRTGNYGTYRSDDGQSRAFQPDSDDVRQIVAEVIARRDGWAEIRSGHWADAGVVVKELKARGMIRTVRERKAARP